MELRRHPRWAAQARLADVPSGSAAEASLTSEPSVMEELNPVEEVRRAIGIATALPEQHAVHESLKVTERLKLLYLRAHDAQETTEAIVETVAASSARCMT